MKTCTKCGETKALDEFQKDVGAKSGYRSDCKACVAARRAGRAKDPGKRKKALALAAQGRKRCPSCGEVKALEDFHASNKKPGGTQSKCKGCSAAETRERRTGHSPALITALRIVQGGKCAVCRAPLTPGAQGEQADHCHDSKVPRGLLCKPCNHAEGVIKKSGLTPFEFGRRLQKYIENPPSTLAQDALNLAG